MGASGEFREVGEAGKLEGELLLHSRHPLQLCLVVLWREERKRTRTVHVHCKWYIPAVHMSRTSIDCLGMPFDAFFYRRGLYL